ncbi:HEAT repeat domain-containing protein [Dolichospermum sp. LEGE 00240]|jgi:HEAT repeat protein|uniref:HEAT repeat domain-containing protein n=1 Tax=Dolichospermum sp. LEGE 00240 TaxID=1828603 RepID=UPI00187E8375|nr:HEAT repeat domain-containing protein [Dolichospermum sp. LEGE 00240]MDM3843477.1 HEAT repeat domain-containing protein [Aphanizomenon gracile PMC638.10]MDM3848887.1 HEAT repeat domain-containing protein [Aphanizomenon gracile PMC627.10]MDM3855892.1 HEAT repeat domain-containing protein [Aphanizomenon gracile PMC649.10]MDM3858450.1 HEAT repeat domain-containing protein [Aphanizomenon gracile PMC644.10]MBE9247741.1 HEAT repeat domain-containing protein [Dolichospermum sp. LEGE 00240]
MYDEYELSLLDTEGELITPLDQIEPLNDESEVEKPDVELMLVLLANPQPQQRMLAARAFCDIQDERATPHLIHLLIDNCPLVRVSAAYGIGRNPAQEAVEPLIRQLNRDFNGYVRKGIVWALGNCRDRRSLAPLTNALRTDIPAVRLWAASALAQMTEVGYEAIVGAIPALIEALVKDPVAAVRSNSAWTIGQLCKELPSNVVYATAIDALIQAFAEDKDLGVREDTKASLLGVGDPRGLQLIETLEQEGWF